MKKQKQSVTNSLVSKQDENKLLTKVTKLLEDSIPKNILGMMATAKEQEKSMLFYDRYSLVPHSKNNYEIRDTYTKEAVYSNIALFKSAINMIYCLKNGTVKSGPKDKIIYELDQEYFRCMENIKFYKQKISSVDNEILPLFLARLTDSRVRLQEIKTRLSKVY